MISDAGTPNISDPGYRLVRSVMEAGFRVVPIPGPSSIITALSVAGIDGSSFVFMGFSPKKELALRSFFQKIDAEERTARVPRASPTDYEGYGCGPSIAPRQKTGFVSGVDQEVRRDNFR